MGRIEFYALPGCPDCATVERVMRDLGVVFEKHEVPPDRNDRRRVKAVTGRTDVPAIVDRAHGIEGLHGSGEILAHLRATYGDRAAPG